MAAQRPLNALGRTLLAYLEEAGISEAELCRRLGVPQSRLNYWKYRPAPRSFFPDQEECERWVAALGLPKDRAATLKQAAMWDQCPAEIRHILEEYGWWEEPPV